MVLAFFIGQQLGQNNLKPADKYVGESGVAERALTDAGLRPNDEVVLIKSDTLTARDPEFQSAVASTSKELSRVKYVENVKSPADGGGSISPDGHAVLVEFNIAGDTFEAAKRVDPTLAATDAVQASHPDFTIAQFGGASAEKAINESFTNDLKKAAAISLPVTLLILIIAFGSLVAAGVPLLLALSAVLMTMGLVAIPSQILPVDSQIAEIILLIGLAVGVDYSLFYMRREREERAAGRSERDSLEIAAATSGRAVLISGLTVIVAMSGMFISGDKTFISFGVGAILVVAVAMVASLTVLPAILAWLGDRIEKGHIPFTSRLRRPAGQSRFWPPIISAVTRHPVISVVLAGGLLLVLAVPALHMKTVNPSVTDLPQDLSVIKTYNQVNAEFPDQGVAASVAVEASDVRSGPAAAGIAELQKDADAADYTRGKSEVTYSDDGTVAEVLIPTVGEGHDAASTNAMNQIRNDLVPATVGKVDGVSANVSGDAAGSLDSRNLFKERLPLIFAFVFSLAFILMLVTFRSIVIPIKAILLNLLSVGAAYGVLVFIFQDVHFKSLLGFEPNGGIASWLPLFLFVVLFGLSMDYHVFILTRVREAYDGGMSSKDAVRHGISTTAGTVTSAAIVMVAVFLTFATASFIDFKELGIGLAVAVLIDATIVRGVLLPGSMELLGDWNWYMPKWLEWIPRRGERKSRAPKPLPKPRPAEG
jgi:uncharacterized membrane protein YdfJ with MMPL/SSD domain